MSHGLKHCDIIKVVVVCTWFLLQYNILLTKNNLQFKYMDKLVSSKSPDNLRLAKE